MVYVFGYASLVGLLEGYSGDVEHAPQPGRLRGYRRRWGVAMDNWRGGEEAKHWLDRAMGERPRIRVAYLDLYEREGSAVNGLALPVEAERLATLDAREVNYRRVDVSGAFEPMLAAPESVSDDPMEQGGSPGEESPPRVFAYLGLAAARERCRLGLAEGNAFVAVDYAGAVRSAFDRLGPGALAELERTTDSCPFPLRDLKVVQPRPMDG
jgi:hypothetical protein